MDGSNKTAYKPQLKSYGDTVFSTYPDLLMTTDMGDTWDTILEGGGNNPYAYMDMEIVGNDVYLSTTSDLRKTSDMGATWTVLQLGSSAFYHKNGEMFHSDSNGEITFSTDNGTTFTNIHGNLPGKVMDVKVAGGSVFAVVSISTWLAGSEIWHSDNRNGTWIQDTVFISGNTDGSAFDILECNDRIIAGTRKDMYMTSDLGATWQNINYNLEPTNQFVAHDIYPREFANDTLYAVTGDSIYKLHFPKTPVGIDEFAKFSAGLSLFPNPSSGLVYMQSNVNVERLEIYNLAGKMLYSTFPNSMEAKMNLADLPKGIYIVKVNSGGEGFCRKIILN